MKEVIVNIFKETRDEKLLTKTKFCRIVSEDIKDGKKDRIKEKATGFKELLDLTKEEIKKFNRISFIRKYPKKNKK